MTEPTDPVEPGPPGDSTEDDSKPIPRLYIASPLTGLTRKRREAMSHRIETVKKSVLDTTVTHRAPAERSPVTMHVPWDHTPPWRNDGLTPGTIYERNLDHMLEADGLIVVADEACSAGIGQEIEWAVRSGIPVLYLSRVEASRQIRGIPHAIDARVCADAETAAAYVANWLNTRRAQLQNGPGRRADRDLAYIKLTAQLEVAWKAAANPTAIAAQLNLYPGAIDSMIKSPARVALTPWSTICALATELGVPLDVRRTLTFLESRAWIKAAEEGAWDQRTASRVRAHAVSIGAADLELPATWAALHGQIYRAIGE